MVDFNKLANRTPEERKAARSQLDSEYKAKEKRIKLMADKLYEQISCGNIENKWAEEFVNSVQVRINAGLPLSEKQISKLEELFDQY